MDKRIIAPDNICMGEDLLRTSQMLCQCSVIAMVEDAFYYYYQNPASIMHKWTQNDYTAKLNIYDILSKTLPADKKKYLEHLSNSLFISLLFHCGENPDDEVFYEKEIKKKRSFCRSIKILFDFRYSFSVKMAYILGHINFYFANKLVRKIQTLKRFIPR